MMSDNTCYPSFSFLPLQWNHHPRRNFFLDCGTLGSIYVCEDGKTLVQKIHNDQNCHLCAQFPSLPLFKKPKYGISGIDPVGQQDLKNRNKKFLYMGKRMRELKTLLKRKKYKPDAILNLLKSVCDYENGDCSMEVVLDNFNQITELRKVYERYSDLFNVDIQKTNTSFTGGCLQIVNIPGEPSRAENDSVHMAAVLGPELNKIKIFRADLEKSGLLSVDESQMIEIDSSQPLFELTNQCLYDQSLLAGRSKDSCFLYNISTENSMFRCLDKISLENEDLTSVFMSPFIPAECLIATDSGSVYLWNADKGYDLVHGQPKGAKCLSRWRDVHYGSHPRSFVLTDHTTMDLFDLRNGKKATNLFSLPCRHLKNRERLQVSKFSTRNSFQHFMATDYALFLLDERFPRYPVLQWQHMLEGLPQYMCLATEVVQSLQEDVLMVGSQYPAEVINIQYRTFESNPPIAVTSPWRISKPLDLFYINNMHHKVEDLFVKKRLTASCIGITGQPLNPEGMLVFQLNSLGDIFFQKYNTNPKFHDKTFSAGPGDHVVQLTKEAKHRGSYWMDHLRENIQTDNFCDVEHQNIISFIKSLSEPPSSHVLCRLCMPQCDNQDIQSDDEDVITGSCMTCNSTLRESKWIVEGVELDKVICSEDITIEKQIPSIKNIPKSSSSLTRTLCKLWNDEELSEAESEEVAPTAESEEEEEEEEVVVEEVEKMNELNSNKTFNFVHWDEDNSEEEPPAAETDIRSTLPDESDENPDSPLLLGPTQVPVIPDSVPMFSEPLSSPTQLSPVASPSKTVEKKANDFTFGQQDSTEQISFINEEKQKESHQLLDNSSDADDSFLPFSSKTIRQTQNHFSFLSPVISQSEMKSPNTSLAKNSIYEDGFGSITDTQQINSPSFLLSSVNKKSWTKPKLKRKYEDGF